MFARVVRALIAVAFPADFQREFGKDVAEAALARVQERRREGRPVIGYQVRTLVDILRAGVAERLSPARPENSARPVGGSGSMRFLESLLRDLRYGARGLLRAPAFTLIAVVTLGLGIGGNTAMFSVLNAVLLRPLDFPEPDRIVRLQVGRPLTARQIDGVAERVSSYSAMAGAARSTFSLTGDGPPEEIIGAVVGVEHHGVFGVGPVLGRPFQERDATPGAPPVAVISHELWQRRFGGDRSVLGRVVDLGGEEQGRRTVVGVWPPGYRPFSWDADVFVPIVRETDSHLYVDMARFRLSARLREGTTYESALQELRTLVAELATGDAGAYFAQDTPARTLLTSYQEATTGGLRGILWMLLGAVGLVLLIACTNVANLVMARSASRSQELAIRTAVGAGRRRVFRQLLTENLLLASVGGAVGVVGAVMVLPALVQALPQQVAGMYEVRVDPVVLAFVALATLASGVAFGLIPTLRSVRSLDAVLRSGSRGAGGGPARFRINRALVATQIGLCVVLVVASGLLLKSLWLASQVNPGFEPDQLYAAQLRPLPDRVPTLEDKRAFYAAALERIARIPGVTDVGGIQVLPMTQANVGVGISPDGAPVADGDRPVFVGYRMVTEGYGPTMGIPLVEGRWLDRSDQADAPPVGLINERMAHGLFGDASAVGRTVHWNTGDLWFTVVGVIGDVHHDGLDRDTGMEAYVPMAQDGDTDGLHVIVRTALGASVLPAMRDAVWSLDPDVPVTREAAMTDLVAASIADRRGQALLFTVFGGLALVLGAIGVYGVTAYTVSQRSHEMGVRLALGASNGAVLRSTLVGALRPVVAGMLLGGFAALIAARLLTSTLYQVQPADPGVLVGVAGFLGVVAALAALGPARRAARTDPMVILNRG